MNFRKFIENKGGEGLITSKNIIYKSRIGYIKGYLQNDGFFWVEEFVIYPKFRGQGLAKKLAEHIPKKSKLLAQPLVKNGNNYLSKEALINFYKSLGFIEIKNQYGNTIMSRE